MNVDARSTLNMPRRIRRITIGCAFVAFALLLSACSTGGAATTTTEPIPAETSTTTAPTTTTSAVATTTTAVETTSTSMDLVGDPGLLAEEFEAIETYLADVYPEYATDPLEPPDFSDPDASVAFRAILAFEERVFHQYPIRDLVRLFTVPGSQAEELFGEPADELIAFGEVGFNEADPAFEISEFRTVSLSEARGAVPDEYLDAAPAGSLVIAFHEMLSDGGSMDRETLDVVQLIRGGEFAVSSIISPTPSGWKLYFYSLERIS